VEQPNTLDDIGRFDLKMFRNCPIRIEIITGSIIYGVEVVVWSRALDVRISEWCCSPLEGRTKI
jgi:hypothetical protein